ncbi:hypothetical protein AQUCO_01500294v1 [Aquilegia coerulea]|uniref:Tryptophan--tRNA ligase, cytoplasmic n=1 Tax=Aquilegia coerulea TaxID=218851 RepID=A0A2G5DTR4_AQUCA|nr:hypothetical protein AQUCO_01500294v1 [Aquilegia coerulea]
MAWWLLAYIQMETNKSIEVKEEEQVVTPWEVASGGGKIDYDKLISKFGCQKLHSNLISLVEKLTSHFFVVVYLQDAFKVPLVIQLTDDEKCIWKNLSVEESKRLARENASAVRGIFGFSPEDHIGKIGFPPAVPSFPTSFPHLFSGRDNLRCLIPCAIDQDPYFRMTRDVAPRIGYQKPALIESLFFPALQGESGKMSASDPNSAIYVTDSKNDIKKKINRHAFSGGQDSLENQRKYGANLEVDIPVKYLSFFLEDDAELEHIKKEYGAGRMLTGEVKSLLIEVLTEMVMRHREARSAVTDEMVDAFMAVRPLPGMFD